MTNETMPTTNANQSTRGPLQKPALAVLILQVLLALGFGIAGMISASGDQGFADLGRIIVAMMVAGWLFGLFIAWLIARFALRATAGRVIFLVIGPALPILVLIVLVRFAG